MGHRMVWPALRQIVSASVVDTSILIQPGMLKRYFAIFGAVSNQKIYSMFSQHAHTELLPKLAICLLDFHSPFVPNLSIF